MAAPECPNPPFPEDVVEEVGRHLQLTLVELVALALAGKQLQWSAYGREFLSLHWHLDRVVDEWRELEDTVAKRAAAIGIPPDGSAAAVIELGDLAPLEVGFTEVGRRTSTVRATLGSRAPSPSTRRTARRAGRRVPGRAGGRGPELEKQHWMMRAQRRTRRVPPRSSCALVREQFGPEGAVLVAGSRAMLAVAHDDAGPLLGRDAETEMLRSLRDRIESSGGALVLRGEPGIGKSRLLAEATALARERKIAVLRTTGVQSEASVAFSGLHQLLRPVRDHAAGLLPAHRAVLDTALGLGDDAAPEHFRIAMAVLDLLSEVAADAPLLVIAEDAHWLDRPSSDVLAFVARRLESDPILLLAAVRDGYRSSLVDAGLPEHRLGALDPATAAALLDASAKQTHPAMRNQILGEAAGNPLALIELPIAAALVGAGHADAGLAAAHRPA